MITIPINSVSPDTLQAMITHFVLREGSDYGENEYTLTDKIAQVLAQLEAGTAILTFDNQTESINIIPSEKCNNLKPLIETVGDEITAEAALLTIRQQLKA
jgi:uncharacterized protein YheU (UPF0270 family)